MIRFNDLSDGRALAGDSYHPGQHTVIARVENGKLLGGVVFKKFTGASIEMHVTSFHPLWLNRDLLWVCFHYPFMQLGCKKVLGVIPANNTKSLEFNRRLGFKVEARMDDIFPNGVGVVISSMTKEECPWLKLQPKGIREYAK
jgi:hypothetical protein